MSQDKRDDYDKQYTTTAHRGAVPITLADEAEQFRALPHESTDLWEETAFALIAESGDHDVLMWSAGYILKGNGRGVWIHKDSVEHDVMLIAVPKANRGNMTDNNFVRAGWHPSERLAPSQLKIERGQDKVVWQFDRQQFIAKPPRWELRGDYAGIEFDLDFTQTGPALWNWGPFQDAAKNGRAGYDAFTSVNGSLQVDGRTFQIANGQGMHEHILTGQANDPIRNLPAPRYMWWLYTIKDGVVINFFRPGSIDIGAVHTEDQAIHFNPAGGHGLCSYRTLETWSDPRNGFDLPVRWHLNMTRKDCVVDLEISAHGRAYEFWTTHDGVRLYCYLACVANGYAWIDGRKIEFDDHLLLNSFNRTISVRTETLQGPQYLG